MKIGIIMHMDELLKRWCLRLSLNQLTLKFAALVMEDFITLILTDHVVHDHTSSRHLPRGLNTPCSSRVMNNRSPRLEHTKYPLHIFPTSILFFGKLTFFLLRVDGLSSSVDQSGYMPSTRYWVCLMHSHWSCSERLKHYRLQAWRILENVEAYWCYCGNLACLSTWLFMKL
jgi:hypothetical protein